VVDTVSAIRAEAFRFRRNLSLIFWGFAFVPLVYIAFAIILELAINTETTQISAKVDLVRQLTRTAGLAGNPLAQLFLAIGAASIFGGDYVQKTWRLLGSRSNRLSLLIAKWAVYVCAAVAGLIFAMIGSALAMFIIALIEGASLVFGHQPLYSIMTATAGSILELVMFGAIVAAVAIGTRSMLAAVFPAFLLSAAQEMLLAYVAPPTHGSLWLGLPTFAGDVIRRSTLGPGFGPLPTPDAVIFAFISLCCWCVLGFVLSWWLIRRQDWSTE
jgi:ABC-2 type transport system permease protein